MYDFVGRRFAAALAVVALLCALILTGCDLEPAIIDVPTPVPTATLMPQQGLTRSKGQPTQLATENPSKQGPEPTLGPGEFTYTNGVPFPVPSTQANPIEAADMQAVWRTNLSIKEIPSYVDSDHVFLLRGIDEDGRFLLGEVAPTGPTSMEESKLALMDLSSHAITYLPDATFQNARTSYLWLGVAVDGDWIVWQQGDGERVTVKIYNRASSSQSRLQITHLSEPSVPGTLTTEPEVTAASVDHGMFVWAELDPNAAEQGKVATVIKSYDFTTGQIAIIGEHGVAPSIAWPYVAWLEPDLTTLTEGDVCSNIVTTNLLTGATNALRGDCELREVAMHDEWIASTSLSRTFIQNASNTRRQIIRGDSGPEIQRLTVNERLVAWAEWYRPMVWDRNLQKVVRLDGFASSWTTADGCIVNGKMLAWQASLHAPDPAGAQPTPLPSDLMIYIMDTTQLAK